MIKTTSKLKRLFEDSELEDLRKAVNADSKIIPALDRIITETYKELTLPTGSDGFKKRSWALEKAFREGGAYYLQQLLDTFKE